jgi:hypothetical protein
LLALHGVGGDKGPFHPRDALWKPQSEMFSWFLKNYFSSIVYSIR